MEAEVEQQRKACGFREKREAALGFSTISLLIGVDLLETILPINRYYLISI